MISEFELPAAVMPLHCRTFSSLKCLIRYPFRILNSTNVNRTGVALFRVLAPMPDVALHQAPLCTTTAVSYTDKCREHVPVHGIALMFVL